MVLFPFILILISFLNRLTSLVEPSRFSIVIFQSDVRNLGELISPEIVGASIVRESIGVDFAEDRGGVGVVSEDKVVKAPDDPIANVIWKTDSK